MPPVPLPQKHELNEEETKHHHITPAIERTGWTNSQIWMEYCFTDGMIQVWDEYINKGAQKMARSEERIARILAEFEEVLKR